jgi:mannan endo-1,4-beta-mannosidase
MAIALVACQPTPSKTEKAKTGADQLLENLNAAKGNGILFGHQDDLAYGIGWKYVEGESDTKRTAGDYPALFGWELGGIELGNEVNLDSVPFAKMKEFATWVYQNGGVNTFSWHPYSALDESKNSWTTEEEVVKHILPGGSHHEKFKSHLDKVANFFSELKTAEGESVPFIFRPWHEMDGGWFWWGAELCSPEELQQLFRFTVEYLHKNGINNFLTAYSPDRNFTSEDEYLTWYPGDDIVDVIGVDNYWDLNQPEGGVENAILKLEIVAKYAHKTGKIAAFTETGSDKIQEPLWFTEKLGAVLNASEWTRQCAYVMVWRNHDLSHFYVPHPNHNAAENFRTFTALPSIWLLEDWRNFVERK